MSKSAWVEEVPGGVFSSAVGDGGRVDGTESIPVRRSLAGVLSPDGKGVFHAEGTSWMASNGPGLTGTGRATETPKSTLRLLESFGGVEGSSCWTSGLVSRCPAIFETVFVKDAKAWGDKSSRWISL